LTRIELWMRIIELWMIDGDGERMDEDLIDDDD
jgi:hypothetical protein